MFDNSTSAADAIARLADAVDGLMALNLPLAADDSVLDVLRSLQTQVNRLGAVDAALVGEVDSRRLWFERGCPTTAALLTQLLRIEPGEARARVATAAELAPRRALTGEVLDPVFPTAAGAVADGSISTRHAAVISRTVTDLPTAVAAEHDGAVETFLVEQAQLCNVATLRRVARRISDTLNPDGTYSDDADRARRRHLDLYQRADGTAAIRAELDAVCTEALLTVLDTLARPAPANDGEPDPRTPGQRRHDGLRDGMLTAIRSGRLPDCGGITTTILVTVTADELRSGSGLARTGHGALIPTRTVAEYLLPDAQIMPITLSRDKRIDNYGPARRLFTPAQRLAMAARDGGCSFPACTIPAPWCEAHHVIAWAAGGPTTVDNGTLLCGYHHREHERLGWSCAMHDGIPYWTPPRWIDPDQRLIRNGIHDDIAEQHRTNLVGDTGIEPVTPAV